MLIRTTNLRFVIVIELELRFVHHSRSLRGCSRSRQVWGKQRSKPHVLKPIKLPHQQLVLSARSANRRCGALEGE